MKRQVVSIVGLTASGKSAIGVSIAREFNGEIISADSRQVYRGLDIGTAKITRAEMKGVPHHLIDVVEPETHFDVHMFQERAFEAIEDILSRGRLPIIVGGTGLYSRSVVENYKFDNSPALPCVRHIKSASARQSERVFEVLQVCLMPAREIIRERIAGRIEERLGHGMIEETRGLIARGVSESWLRGLGLEYKFNVELIRGEIGLEEYKGLLLTASCQYAKRQRTWFKREKDTVFLTEVDTFLQDTRKAVAGFVED